jgi:hypothetical protein
MKSPKLLRIVSTHIVFIILLEWSLVANAQTCCLETNGVKWIQRPEVGNGIDFNATMPFTLADDFKCTNSGRITDIHLWGSWLTDQVDPGATYTLAIWSDAPTNVDRPFSHPGIMVWSQVFGPNTYTLCPYTNVSEPFFNPGTTVPLGGSSNLYYLCFYPDPATIFRQGGSPNQPTNYWLSVTVQPSSPTAPFNFGWKSSADHYNDTAVQTTAAFPPPSSAWNPFYGPTTGAHVDLAFKITTDTNTSPVCVENGVKYEQDPKLFGGLDVWNNGPWVLADDFVCNYTGPISDIHIWGSWLTNNVATNSLTFWLAIYDNVQVSPTNNFSRPGNLLWKEQFAPGRYIESFYAPGQETFLDPGPPNPIGPDSQAWYYCFYPTNQFTQTNGNIYWLMVYAQSQAGNTQMFGWKTSSNVLNDISVHAPWPGLPPTINPGWQPTLQASTGGSLDLAFKITTVPRPPIVCVESDFDKYVQVPNIFGGFDVLNNPDVLADDFVCTNTGPLSDIHLWGSWLNDFAMTNSIMFWLGIYDDVPIGGGNTFSHPGTNLLWQQWFSPGQYAETIWTNNAQELFIDPSTSNALSSDSVVWYYCFYPTNAFQQTGTSTNAKTYWLAAYAQYPVGASKYGWKTTTTVLKDTSVHAVWPGGPPIANPGWTPTAYQPAAGGPPVPLDLAFKMTMCGPVTIHTNAAPWSVVVSWSGGGFLQSATNVTGPYVDVPGFPPSPYIDSTVSPTNKFYRLRCY